jgi:hypothetical protein
MAKLQQHVYLLFSGSEEKVGQVYPSILEFESQAELDKWLAAGGQEYLDHSVKLDGECFGGWPSWHWITPGRDTERGERKPDKNYNPWSELKEWKEDQEAYE